VPLVNCPTCKHQISDQASACPSCGHPMRRTEYTTFEVIEVGGESRGRQELNRLLSQGWQITHEEYVQEGVDGDGYSRARTRYDLRR